MGLGRPRRFAFRSRWQRAPGETTTTESPHWATAIRRVLRPPVRRSIRRMRWPSSPSACGAHGVEDFLGPRSTRTLVSRPARVAPTGSLIEMDREVIDEAMGACQDLLPRDGRGPDRTPRTWPPSRTRLSSMRSACASTASRISRTQGSPPMALHPTNRPGHRQQRRVPRGGRGVPVHHRGRSSRRRGGWEVTTNE
jgi:hypothetical protein